MKIAHIETFLRQMSSCGRPEGLEPHRRSHLTLDRSMVLFDNIVEVLDLPDLDLCVSMAA